MKNLEQYHSKKVKVETTYGAVYKGICIVEYDYETDEPHLEIERECDIQVVYSNEIVKIEKI